VAASLGVLLAARLAQAVTITVYTTADDTTVNGNCTLREAITAANTYAAVDACASGAAGADTIDFNIPTTDSGYSSATGVFTISPTSGGMSQITEPLTIDGYNSRTRVPPRPAAPRS
jgi:CSLREA domain-containing protein